MAEQEEERKVFNSHLLNTFWTISKSAYQKMNTICFKSILGAIMELLMKKTITYSEEMKLKNWLMKGNQYIYNGFIPKKKLDEDYCPIDVM